MLALKNPTLSEKKMYKKKYKNIQEKESKNSSFFEGSPWT